MGHKSTWTWSHLMVFILTYLGYALFHGCRKSWSNVKDSFEKSITPQNVTDPIIPYSLWERRQIFSTVKDTNVFIGILDTLFLGAYAIGLYLSGIIGDRINLRYMLSGGMILSAVSLVMFGFFTEVTGFRNTYFYGATFLMCGMFQSTGWPATVAIMGNWFGKDRSGLIFGIWASNTSVGNIVGAMLVSCVLDYGYEYGILVTSYFLFCGGIAVFCCLNPYPTDIGLGAPDKDNHDVFAEDREFLLPNTAVDRLTELNASKPWAKDRKAISLIGALRLPGVVPYSLSHACLKLVSYSFFFWLPLYLDQGLHWSAKVSDRLSNFFDTGGLVGGIVAGFMSDLIRRRSLVVVLFLITSVISLYWYSNVGTDYYLNVAVMTLTGFLIGGPGAVITTAITVDLSKQVGVDGDRQALATVTGIVDGTGSVGAAIGQFLVPVIQKNYGWHMVFIFLIVMVLCCILCILPMLFRELENWCTCNPKQIWVAINQH